MKQLVHLKSTITPFARGAMRCPPLGRVFLFVAHLLACVALAPVTQACGQPRGALATYVASYSFTANWFSGSGSFRPSGYHLDVSTSSSFSTYVPGYQGLNVGNVTRRSVTGLNPSTAYYFRVQPYRGVNACGSYSTPVYVRTLSPTGPPAVITDRATYIASYSARLKNIVDPHGLTTTVYFQYGTSTNYGLTTAIQSKTGDTYQNVVATIGGLTASTTYHFRIVATNSVGTRYGADQTFTTLSPTGPPGVITSPATNVTSSSATLNGSVDPHGLTTNVHFQYGTTTSYGHTTANQTKTGNAYQNVAANISGLSASTTYHFRIVGTNTSGTTYGSDRTLPGNSEIPAALGHIAQDGGHVDESIAYFEQGLALDPRNMDLLVEAAATYAQLRQFPDAIRLYDRALDVTPDDPELIALKAAMYQAEGNLQESAKLLIDVDQRTTSVTAFATKLDQLRLERNHAEAIRLLQARRAQVPSACDDFEMIHLAFAQRFVGDTTGAKVTAEQARNTLEPLCKEQPDNPDLEVELALADAVLGERDSALREAEHTIMAARIYPPVGRTADDGASEDGGIQRHKALALDDKLLSASNDLVYGAEYEECLAVIQTVLGENSRAISTLTQLLKTPYDSLIYGPAPVTPALLRLDPIWDPLRTDPAFQKLCEE